MSMARDTSFRPARTDDAYEPATAGAKNDPLTELARLIGQEDPFAKLGRPSSRNAAPAEPAEERHASPGWLAPPQAREPAEEDQPPDHYAAYGDQYYEDDPRYDAQSHDAYQTDAYYDDGQGYAEEGYDEPPPEKRRGGLRTVATVVGLAFVATAGLFGYRAWTSPAGPATEPKVVLAEQTPTKVVPAGQNSSAQMTKPIYDRVDDRSAERVVTREEQPVDPNTAVRQTGPASAMLPAPTSTGSILPVVPPPPALAGAEPKKVRTETIRPNQPASPPPSAANTRIASAPPPAAAPAPAAAPVTRSIATTTTAPAPAPAAAPVTRSVATTTVPARAPAAEAGGYVVQVASQRSESDAQASFKALQQKYPSVLGSHHVTVRRADLGEKGVYYRAQVGPFATAEQAQEMCSSLKSAGGQCLVQRN